MSMMIFVLFILYSLQNEITRLFRDVAKIMLSKAKARPRPQCYQDQDRDLTHTKTRCHEQDRKHIKVKQTFNS